MKRLRTTLLCLSWVVSIIVIGFGLASWGWISAVEAQQRTAWPSTTLITDATAVTIGSTQRPAAYPVTIQCYGAVTATTGAASILIEGSNIEAPSTTSVDWVLLDTLELTLGTTRTSDWGAVTTPFRCLRAHLASISGTNATVSCRLGAG